MATELPAFSITEHWSTEHNSADSMQILLTDIECRLYDLTITAHAGFNTDLASTPKWLWSLYPPMGRYSRAAIIHDFLYSPHGVVWDSRMGKYRKVTRSEADKVLRIIMQNTRCRFYTPWVFWLFVRIFGFSHFHKEA